MEKDGQDNNLTKVKIKYKSVYCKKSIYCKVKSIYCKLSLTTDNSKRIIIKKRLGKIHFTRSSVGQPICILTVVLLLQRGPYLLFSYLINKTYFKPPRVTLNL